MKSADELGQVISTDVLILGGGIAGLCATIKARQNLARVAVRDHHELSRYHQAESMALAAEFTTKAALMRQETRGQHYRQDFPNRDDKNWLKWIVIQEKDGAPQFSTEAVPIEKYRVKPQ